MGMDYLLRTRHLILCPLSQRFDAEQDESLNTDLTRFDSRYLTLVSFLHTFDMAYL